MPSTKPKSPTRLTRKALRLAKMAVGRVYQKPISWPASPASNAAISGNIGMASSNVGFMSAFQPIECFDTDGAPLAEQHHQYRQSNGGLGRGHGEHEKYEDLSVELPQVAREGHEIEVRGQQQQLDAHEQQQHVLAVEKYASHRQREQYRRQGQHVRQRDHWRGSESILTRRTRSLALAATCLPMFCNLSPGRCRKVSVIAATMATSSSMAAISSG